MEVLVRKNKAVMQAEKIELGDISIRAWEQGRFMHDGHPIFQACLQ